MLDCLQSQLLKDMLQTLLVKPRVALDALGSNTNDIRQAFDPAHLKVDGQVVLPVIISKLGTHMEPSLREIAGLFAEHAANLGHHLICTLGRRAVCVEESLDKPWFGKVAATKHIEQAARKLAQPFDC